MGKRKHFQEIKDTNIRFNQIECEEKEQSRHRGNLIRTTADIDSNMLCQEAWNLREFS